METIDRQEPDRRLGQLKDAGPGAEVEARIVRGALARIEGRSRASVWGWRWLVPTAAVAGAAAAFALWPRPLATVEPGTYVARAEPARFSLGPHQIELASETTAELVQTEPGAVRIALGRGKVDCDVDPLAADETFEVRTEHARVAVVGTRFVVEADDGCTRVRVTEGRVRVEGDAALDGALLTLGAGETEELCVPEPEPATEPAPAVEPPPEADLMRAALDRMAAGEIDAAVADFEAYRATYPDGAFVEDALFHQAVLELKRDNFAAAEALVNRFAERFPDSSRRKTLEGMLQK